MTITPAGPALSKTMRYAAMKVMLQKASLSHRKTKGYWRWRTGLELWTPLTIGHEQTELYLLLPFHSLILKMKTLWIKGKGRNWRDEVCHSFSCPPTYSWGWFLSYWLELLKDRWHFLVIVIIIATHIAVLLHKSHIL